MLKKKLLNIYYLNILNQIIIKIKKIIKKINQKINNQIKLYKEYQNFFLKYQISGFPKLKDKPGNKDAVSTFNILVRNRNKIIKIFKKKKISFKIYYPKPLYAQYKLRKKIKLKNTEFLCKSIISLPFNELNKKRFNLVKKYLKEIIRSNKKVFFEKKI